MTAPLAGLRHPWQRLLYDPGLRPDQLPESAYLTLRAVWIGRNDPVFTAFNLDYFVSDHLTRPATALR